MTAGTPRRAIAGVRTITAEVIDSADGTTFALSAAGTEVLTHHDSSLWYAGGALNRPQSISGSNTNGCFPPLMIR